MTGFKAKKASLTAVLLALTVVFSGCQAKQESEGPRAVPNTSVSDGAAKPVVPPQEDAEVIKRPPPTPPKPVIRHFRGEGAKPATGADESENAGSGAAQVQDDATALDTALARLKAGTLAYNTPQRMKMAETAHIVAKIASEAVSADALKAAMPNDAGTQTVTEATSITPQMKMTLTSADFDITPLSSEEQIVAGTVPTTWAWDIVPKHSGTLRLHLAATIELNGLAKDFTTVDREIAVKVDPADAVGGFIRSNWQWLIATLTALVGGAWKFFRARKKAGVAVNSPDA